MSARRRLRPGGVPLVLLAIGSLQFGAALAGTVFDQVGPAGTALLRAAFAAVFLWLIARPDVRAHEPRHLRLAAVFGVLLGLMNLCIYESFARIGLGIAVTIEFAGPLAVAVALSRKRSDLACAALAAVGILLLADPAGRQRRRRGRAARARRGGVLGRLHPRRAGRREGVRGHRGPGARDEPSRCSSRSCPGIVGGGSDLLAPEVLAIGAAVALLSSVLPYSLETEALRRVPAHVFGVLMSLEPAVAALAGFLVLGEGLRTRDVVAIVLVMAASVVVTRSAPPAAEA